MNLSQGAVAPAGVGYVIPRIAADEVTLDFDGTVMAATVLDGSAVIGGGFVASYSGFTTCELGFPTPPFITTFTAQNVNGRGPDSGIYYAVGVWQWFDQAGVLHRSMPSPAETYNSLVAQEELSYGAQTYAGSHRTASDVNAVLYRSSTEDSNFRRLLPPTYVVSNVDTTAETAIHYETEPDAAKNVGTPKGEFLYTQGGAALENVSPEGCQIMRVAIDRLWLGDFFRRDRIQFSKPFKPGTASEHAIAPEFNEAFNKLTPDGRRATGLAELGDRLIVFTSEAIYWLAGDGPDDRGAGSDYPPLTKITADTGCTEPRSVVETPDGIMFLGDRGIYTLTRADEIKFTGFSVVDQTDAFPTITSASINPNTNEVYFTCNNADGDAGQVLVYNYAVRAWSRWTPPINAATVNPAAITGATMHLGDFYIFTVTDNPPVGPPTPDQITVYKLDTTTHLDGGSTYVVTTVETGWFTAGEAAGWRRVRKSVPVMTREDGHSLTVEVYKDFETTADQTASFTGAVVATHSATHYTPVVHHASQKGSAYKLKIYDADDVATSTGNHGGFTISAIMLEWLSKRGLVKAGEGQRV